MNIKQLEQEILRPQLIEGVIFKRLPSFLDWIVCILIGSGVGLMIHTILS